MTPAFTRDQVEQWLDDLGAGTLDLSADNAGLAHAALGMLSAAPEPLPEGNLSPHFTLAEFTYSDTAVSQGIDNVPDDDALAELQRTAALMEGVREICGRHPVLISSGYRCPELNAAIGGASNSAHLYGCAADFTIPGYGSVVEVCRALEPHLVDLQIDQLIYENEAWVHIGRAIPPSTAARCQCLTISGGYTQYGIIA